MKCTEASIMGLLEYIELRLEEKARELGIPEEKTRQLVMEIEKIRIRIRDQGFHELEESLGL